MKKCIWMLVVIVCAGNALMAQDYKPAGPFALNMDYARFQFDDQAGYLEIYYAFYPHNLTYATSSGSLHGGVRMHSILTNNVSKAKLIDRRVMLPVVISDTAGAAFRHPFTTQSGHAVPFGEYTLEVVAVDSLDLSRRDSASFKIDIKALSAAVSISDLELSSRVQPSAKKDDPFYKNSLEVVPNATLVFGVATHPVLFNYAELYGLNPEDTYTVKSQIVDAEGKTMKESSKSRKFTATTGVDAGMMNVTSIMPGRYMYRLMLMDESSAEVARAEKTFYVYNPHLKPVPPTEMGVQLSQLAILNLAELDAEFRKAKYLANKDEIKFYSQLDAEVGKREFLAKFWEAVEMGRGDRPAMKRSEYLRRVEHATKTYSSMNREGWVTDRGRVYILYGEPDHLERVQNEANSKPYQVWHYYELERGVQFVFIDRLGNGDFQLFHSTKRGELQDENWEVYLR